MQKPPDWLKTDDLEDSPDMPPNVKSVLADVGLFVERWHRLIIKGYIEQLQEENRKLREERDGEDR